MKGFIDDYRRFRHLVREEIGDLEEPDILMLFSVWVDRKPQLNPFAGLETFFKGYTDIFQPNNPHDENPDDENNNDDPFSQCFPIRSNRNLFIPAFTGTEMIQGESDGTHEF